MTAESIVRDLKYGDIRAPYLLAFSAEVDDRPLYVESALLAVEFTPKKWRLVHVYRHPKEETEHRDWHVSIVYDTPHVGYRDFDEVPTETEVEKFLRDTSWEFRAYTGFRLLRGEVYYDTWRKALGYTPNHEFPKPNA